MSAVMKGLSAENDRLKKEIADLKEVNQKLLGAQEMLRADIKRYTAMLLFAAYGGNPFK